MQFSFELNFDPDRMRLAELAEAGHGEGVDPGMTLKRDELSTLVEEDIGSGAC